MKITKPQRLKKGDSVAIVSPSSFISGELKGQFNEGIKFLKSLGLRVEIGKYALGRYYYSSGTIEERLSDIHEAFADKKIKALIMSIGGETANQLLNGLDFDLIAKNPKIISGISDGTTLLDPIFTKTGLITYHGPDVIFGFGLPMSDSIKDNMMKTWFGGSVGRLMPNPGWKGLDELNKDQKYEGWSCIRKGVAKGRLIGGNISCLLNLENTEFRPDYKDKILFFESFLSPASELDRLFTHFLQSKVFDEISGLILGHFYGAYSEGCERTIGEIISEVTKDYAFPILEMGEIGHNVENYIIPVGCLAEMDAENKTFEIMEKTVE